MLCKNVKNDKIKVLILMVVGVVSLVFGIVFSNIISEEQHNLMMLSGMFSGLGTAFIVIGIISIIKMKTITAEKLKKKEIEQNDERNIQVLRAAYSVVASASIFIFAILAFVFVGIGYKVPGIMMVVAMYVEVLIFFITYKINNKKM